MSHTQFNPHSMGGGAPAHAGYPGPGNFQPPAYQPPGAPGGFAPPGYPAPNPGFQAPAPADLTKEGVLNDDVQFELLGKLPDQGLNQSTRFCFLLFSDRGEIRFRQGDMFYSQIGRKRFPFLAPDPSHPLYAHCVDRWNLPVPQFASIVLAYDTDRDGNIIAADTFKYTLYALRYNAKWGTWFRSTNKRKPFTRCDLIRTCTKEKTDFSGPEYTFGTEDPNVFATLPDDMRAGILEKALFLHNTYLGPTIGRPRKDDEIMKLLQDIDPNPDGQGGGQPQQAPANLWAGAPGYGQPQMGYNQQHPQHLQGPPPGGFPPQQFQGQHVQRPPQTFAPGGSQGPAHVQQARPQAAPGTQFQAAPPQGGQFQAVPQGGQFQEPQSQGTQPQDFGAALAAASHQMPAGAQPEASGAAPDNAGGQPASE